MTPIETINIRYSIKFWMGHKQLECLDSWSSEYRQAILAGVGQNPSTSFYICLFDLWLPWDYHHSMQSLILHTIQPVRKPTQIDKGISVRCTSKIGSKFQFVSAKSPFFDRWFMLKISSFDAEFNFSSKSDQESNIRKKNSSLLL